MFIQLSSIRTWTWHWLYIVQQMWFMQASNTLWFKNRHEAGSSNRNCLLNKWNRHAAGSSNRNCLLNKWKANMLLWNLNLVTPLSFCQNSRSSNKGMSEWNSNQHAAEKRAKRLVRNRQALASWHGNNTDWWERKEETWIHSGVWQNLFFPSPAWIGQSLKNLLPAGLTKLIAISNYPTSNLSRNRITRASLNRLCEILFRVPKHPRIKSKSLLMILIVECNQMKILQGCATHQASGRKWNVF